MASIDLIVFLRAEDAAGRRFHAEHREVVAGNHLGLQPLGLIVHADRRRHEAAAQHLGE